ncbi:hypothetical protein WG66_005735 [Moniliophthora roreri]|uniref:Uncharacterized protein n=1 Tax=Moniliophthora roreri TaxID=221103 RepID=A0A0W0GCN8_MONRR|nr:hypothetical protein WG66_005735 [Moniliophthora roreri]
MGRPSRSLSALPTPPHSTTTVATNPTTPGRPWKSLSVLPTPPQSTTTVATNPTTPTASNSNITIAAPRPSTPQILDRGQDVTNQHLELHRLRLSIQEFALSALPVFKQIIGWVYDHSFSRKGPHHASSSVLRNDREFKENLSSNIDRLIRNEYPDVNFIRDSLNTDWGYHYRPDTKEGKENCREIMLNADLMETTSKILSGSAEVISLPLKVKCIIKFLYIMTELHELMHFLITKCLTFMDENIPSLPHTPPLELTGSYFASQDSSWGESGFQFEVMMFGFVPKAVRKKGETKVEAIQRLDGCLYAEGKRHYYSLSDGPFLSHLGSFVQGVEDRTLKPTSNDFPLHSTSGLNRVGRVGNGEYRARGFGSSDPEGGYSDHDSCIITSADGARRVIMGQ